MAISWIAGWAVVGVLLLLMEAFFVGGFFLSFASSAFITGILVHCCPLSIVGSLVVFSALGLILIYRWRILLKHLHKDQTNINDY